MIKKLLNVFTNSADRRGTDDVPMREILGLLGWEARKSTAPERIVFVSAVSATLLVVPLFFIMRFAGQSSENSVWVSVTFFFVIASSLFFLLRRSWPVGSGGFAALSAFLEATKIPAAITDTRGKLVGSNKLYRNMFIGGVFTPNALMARDLSGEKGFAHLHSRVAQGREGRAYISLSQNVFKELVNPAGSGNYELIARPYGSHVVWMFERFDPNLQVSEASGWFDKLMAPFLDKALIAVMFFNHEGDLSYYNSAALKILNLSKKNMAKLNHDEVMQKGGVLSNATAQGRIPLDVTEVPLPGLVADVSSPGGSVVFLRERDAAKQIGDSQVTQKDLSRIYEGSPIAIVSVAETGRVLEFNNAFAMLYESRLGKKLLLGAKFTDFVNKEQRGQLIEVIKKTIKGASPSLPIDFGVAGSESIVYQTFFGTGSSFGESSAILYMIDTTDQKRLELQFAQGQKMQAVGQLAGGVAHDFNNLLTAIIGFCDLLLIRHRPGDQSFADIMQIKQSANRGANLVRQLLAFSRRQTLQPKIINITDVIAELANLIRRLVGEGIDLQIIHGRNLGRVKVDQGQLEQVIINLAVNSRDAILENGNSDATGSIKVKTKNIKKSECEALGFSVMIPNDYVEIIVEDTGSGIPASFQDKVFEPFFTTKQVGKGTGLGLATVYGIVKQTGGYIFVDTKRKIGTALKVYLPVYKEEKVARDVSHVEIEGKKHVERDLTGAGNVLVVEDEDAVRLFTVRALTNKGYKVLEANCGEAALELIKASPDNIDIMVSDVVMPGIDGPTLAREASLLQPNMKIILTSGYAEEAFSKKQDQVKYEFIPKPFSLDELASRVKSVLGDDSKS